MARLTDEQKKKLDNMVIDAFKHIYEVATSDNKDAMKKVQAERYMKNGLSYMNIYNLISDKIDFYLSNPSTSISYAIGRINKTSALLIYNMYGDRFFYKADGIILDNNSLNFTKDKNKLIFKCKTDLYYDFSKHDYNMENFLKRLCTRHAIADKIFNIALQYEWIFNYTNNINEVIEIVRYLPEEAYKTMPKGLYQEIEKNNGKLTYELLNDCYFYNKYGKFYKFAMAIIENDRYGEDVVTQLNCFLEKNTFDVLFKMIKNSLLNGDLYFHINDFLTKYSVAIKNGIDINIDSNRDMRHNIDALQDIMDREKNNLLAQKLQKLNFINGIHNDKFVVIVPQSQEEKKQEGQMQNNCVGYYYDDSILRGENLIYFVRKIEKPSKSYVTCRYHVQSQATTEYRLKNNYGVNDKDTENFIKQIDILIRENLS